MSFVGRAAMVAVIGFSVSAPVALAQGAAGPADGRRAPSVAGGSGQAAPAERRLPGATVAGPSGVTGTGQKTNSSGATERGGK